MRTSDLPATTAVAATDVFESENARGTPQKNTLTQILTFISSGALRSVSPSAGIGYATGAGLAVTQITNRSTEVIIAAICGAITTDATSLAAGDEATFTVTNTAVAVGDVVVVSFNIRLTNLSADTADTGASIINFAVIKAVGA
jgi:hypothetical protein